MRTLWRGNSSAAARQGMSSLELLVAFSLLVTAMASTVPLYVRHQRLLSESRRERVALEELANVAERIQAGGGLDLSTLEPSETARRRLPGVALSVGSEPTQLGERVLLSLFWNDAGRRDHPLTLAVWLPAPAAPAADRGEEVQP
jgi:type II secretory pathway pseudopilin PulG